MKRITIKFACVLADKLIERRGAAFALTSVACLLVLSLGNAEAATRKEPVHIGRTTSVIDNVSGRLGDTPAKQILQAEKIFFNEAVITAVGSAVVIQFRDGSTFELGENGAMTLDELVFNPYESESKKVMTLLQGSFRYVSGFVAQDSLVTLITPTATIGIRGSSVSGNSSLGQPGFLHVSKGTASYANDAGEQTVKAGQSVASVDRDSPPIEPARMPPAVAAQAMTHIQAILGDAPVSQPLTTEQKADDAAANVIPVADQLEIISTTAPLAAAPEVAAPANVAAVIPLLTQAAEVGVLAGGQTEATPAQQAFIEQANLEVPNAVAQLEAATTIDQTANAANVISGTTEVVAGSSENAESAEQLGALVKSAVGSNTAAAGLIAETAVNGTAANDQVDITEAVSAATKGAVSGATGSGAEIAAIAEAASKGVIAGAVKGGSDATSAAAAATQGAVSGAVEAGGDISAIIKASADGAVSGALDAGTDASAAAQAATEGAVTGAVEAGTDISAVTKAATDGAVTGAVDSGADAAVAAQAATQGAVSSAAKAGADIGAVTKAAADGAITGAIASGADAAATANAATQGAISGAVEAGADVGAAIQAATEGAISGTIEAGGDVAATANAATQGAVAGATSAGLDASAAVSSATQGITSGASNAGISVDAAVQAATEGAIAAAIESGGDAAAFAQAAISGVVAGAAESGADVMGAIQASALGAATAAAESDGAVDPDAITDATTAGAVEAAQDLGIETAAITDAVEEQSAIVESESLAAIESAAGTPTDGIVPTPLPVDGVTDSEPETTAEEETVVDAPEAENPSQSASPS